MSKKIRSMAQTGGVDESRLAGLVSGVVALGLIGGLVYGLNSLMSTVANAMPFGGGL